MDGVPEMPEQSRSEMSRRRFIRDAGLGVAALSVPGFAAGRGAAQTAEPDALHRRVRAELGKFTGWLAQNGVDGYIGEVGWPDDYGGDTSNWNALAEAWYDDADAAGLWVTQWSTGEWWGTDYKLAVYEDRQFPAGVDSANSQAIVTEAHPTTPSYLRGVNVSGAEFGAPYSLDATSSVSNKNPGRYNIAYHYDGQATFDYLAGRGIGLIRLQFRWERIQPTPGGPLNRTELRRLKGAVRRATDAGLEVIL